MPQYGHCCLLENCMIRIDGAGNINRFASLLLVLFVISGCNNSQSGMPHKLTDMDTLSSLVHNSDLIAVVDISGGTDEARASWRNMPKEVSAYIESVVKGSDKNKTIKIANNPKNSFPGSVMEVVVLRNGRHLVFLSQDGGTFKPTTGKALLDVLNNKVYPIWRPDQYNEIGSDGIEFSRGIGLDEVLEEIRTEIETGSRRVP